MTAVELYRAEKARHFARLEPVFQEIRARLEITPNALSKRNKARAANPGTDKAAWMRAYWQANRETLMAKQRARRNNVQRTPPTL